MLRKKSSACKLIACFEGSLLRLSGTLLPTSSVRSSSIATRSAYSFILACATDGSNVAGNGFRDDTGRHYLPLLLTVAYRFIAVTTRAHVFSDWLQTMGCIQSKRMPTANFSASDDLRTITEAANNEIQANVHGEEYCQKRQAQVYQIIRGQIAGGCNVQRHWRV